MIVFDNISTGSSSLLLHQEKLYLHDLSDESALQKIFKHHSIEYVLHFAASIIVPDSVKYPDTYYENNTINTLKLLRLATKAGVKKFIFSSTAAVYGISKTGHAKENDHLTPLSPYGHSKLAAEMIIKDMANAYDLRYVILRYFNVAGADPQHRIGQMNPKATNLIKKTVRFALDLEERLTIYGSDYETPDGTGVRDYIHVEDLALAHCSALSYLDDPNALSTILNVGYGVGHSVLEVIEAAQKVTGKIFKVNRGPRRLGDPSILIADPSKIQRTLNWVPKYHELEQIIYDAFIWEAKCAHIKISSHQV